MKFPVEPLWKIAHGHFVSTANTFDQGLETMVFPASDDAKIVYDMRRFRNTVVGVNFGAPIAEYTRHYATIEDAKRGHQETVRAIRDRFGMSADEKRRERQRKRAEAGLCVKCGVVPASAGYKTCFMCRKRAAQYCHDYYQRKVARQKQERNDQSNE